MPEAVKREHAYRRYQNIILSKEKQQGEQENIFSQKRKTLIIKLL
jgi:hypothetical protein